MSEANVITWADAYAASQAKVKALTAQRDAAVEDARLSRAAAGAEAICVNELTAENEGLVTENNTLADQLGALLAAARQAVDALQRCYDVAEWPANGETTQDKAIVRLNAAIALCAAKEPTHE